MGQQVLNAIFIGSIYALFAVGYTLVFGVLDILNLAHSAVFMLGAAVTFSLVANYNQAFQTVNQDEGQFEAANTTVGNVLGLTGGGPSSASQ